MKQSLLWRGLLVWACALAATGCSLLKVSVSSGDPLPDETLRLRTMTRGFYYDLSSGIAAAADSVVAASPRAATQLAAIRWKIRATRAAVEAAMQSDPEVALADTWILCRRMNEAFAQLPDSLLFGAESSIAREAAARFERRVARLSEQLLPADRQRVEIQHYVSTEREALVGQVQQAADEAVQHALERIPAVIGRLLFYVVAALVVLLGLPFLVGFWLGGLRARRQSYRRKAPEGDDSAPEQGGGSPDEGRSGPGESR